MTSGLPAPLPRPERTLPQPQPVPVAPRPSRPRRRRWVVAFLVVAAAAGALYLRNLQVQPTTGGGPPVVTVPTAKLAIGDLVVAIRLTGATAAERFSILKAPQMRGGRGSAMSEVREVSTGAGRRAQGGGGSSGGGGGPNFAGGGRGNMGAQMTLTSLVAGGSMVKKGDVVAEFDREDMLTRLDEFRTRVAQNRASLDSVQAQLQMLERRHGQTVKEARGDVDRARLDLKTMPVRSAIDAERYRLALEEAEAAYKQVSNEVPLMRTSLESQWKLALLARDEGEAEMKRVEANVDRMVLRAPIDGLVVLMTTMRRGSADQAQLKAGDQIASGMPILQIVDLSSMIVNATVNQVDADKIRIGAEAAVRVDAYPDLELPAEVYAIGALPKAGMFRGEYVKDIPITLKLKKLDRRILPDLSVSADVVLNTEPQALMAPREAIFREGPEGKPYVFLQQPGGWVRREIELGKASYVSSAVLSGLKAGDVVACERPRMERAVKK